MPKRSSHSQSGSILVSILVVTLFLFVIVLGLIVFAGTNLNRAKGRIFLLQAQYAAESGADTAIAQFNNGNESYSGTSAEVTVLSNARYKSTYTVSVAAGSSGKEKVVTATGKVYVPATATQASFSRAIEVVAQRTSTSVVTSGMISRNILEVQSGVKNLYAKDIYINGYIHMNKNTTNLIAENITVGGKNTGASNCSIGGTGNLVKPTSFTDPSQTKTNITMAYNNCISPPGNTSNANFTVLANQTNIPKVLSTYVPWSQYMDSNYKNSPTGCSDWTSGSSPRTIPSTGNSKKTHYPDSASNISTSCGSSGDLNLGSARYNINDNVHIRANLCAASACNPSFYNPDQGADNAKYIFVEGTINFSGVQSVAGSGPVVLVSYGADPSSKTSVCPYGAAIYLGNTGTVFAPDIYFLALNGLCLDNTKFSGTPNFGGLSGKNIYISSSPGSPFDATLNTTFPVSTVPIDLAWRAVRYRRL